ncbi:hypothetical protein H9P43_006883 [Blastocladiella emersonii ATCC 22665]|nr:hypothetical protein H9P43_006883 [Blastocladiella emersonii ATCC 22665]
MPPGLEVLDLLECAIWPAGLAAIALVLPLTLQVLRLGRCFLDDAAVFILVEAGVPPALREIEIAGNKKVTDAGVVPLIGALPRRVVERIDLAGTAVSGKVPEALLDDDNDFSEIKCVKVPWIRNGYPAATATFEQRWPECDL